MGELYNSIGKPLASFFKGAIEGASDLQETVSKTNVVFGDMADSVLEWSESATTTMGLSRNSALSMASAFGDLATSMGLARSQSQSMAMNLTQLAADLASFKNIDAQQAFTALQGIFTGNAQALKSLGVVMNETTLEAYAMSQGITTSYNAMSESEKVALRYQFVLAQTANAQGDFARTSSGYANATRTLQESVSDLTASFGEMLLPMMETIIGAITDIVNFINDMPDELKAVITALGLAATAFTVLVPIINKATAAFGAFKSMLTFTSPLGWIAGIAAAVAGIGAIVSAFSSANSRSEEEAQKIKEKVDTIKTKLAEIDGDHPVNYSINITDNSETVSSKYETIASNFANAAATTKTTLDGLETEYNSKNLSIQFGITATGWSEGGSPDEALSDEDRNVDVDLTGVGLDTTDIDGKETVEVDTYASKDGFDTDALQGAQVDVKTNATSWVDGGAPLDLLPKDGLPLGLVGGWEEGFTLESLAHAIGIPVYQEGELIIDGDPSETLKKIIGYIEAEENDINTALKLGDTRTVDTKVANLVHLLKNLHIQFNSESEREWVEKFDNWRDNKIKELQNLTVKIATIDDSAVDYTTLKTNLEKSLLAMSLNAQIVSLTEGKNDKNQTAWQAFQAEWQAAEHSLEAIIALREAGQQDGKAGQETETAKQLLADMKAYDGKTITTDADFEIDQTDLDALEKYAYNVALVAGSSWEAWKVSATGAIEEVSNALYEDATGKKNTGSVYDDLLEIQNQINAGFGTSTAWSQLEKNLQDAATLTTDWKGVVNQLNEAFQNTVKQQLAAKNAFLYQEAFELAYAYNNTTDENLKKALEAELQFALDALEANTRAGKLLEDMSIEWSNDAKTFASQTQKATDTMADAGVKLTDQTGTYIQEMAKMVKQTEADGRVSWESLISTYTRMGELFGALPKYDFSETLGGLYEKEQDVLKRRLAVEDARSKLNYDEKSGYNRDLVDTIIKRWSEVEQSPELEESYRGKTDILIDELAEDIGLTHDDVVELIQTFREDKQVQKDEAKMREDTVAAFTGMLQKIAAYSGTGDLDSVKTVADAMRGVLTEMEHATAAQMPYLQKEYDELQQTLYNWGAKYLAEGVLTGNTIPEEVIAQLDESSQEFLRGVNEFIEKGTDITDPSQLAAALSYIGGLLGVDLLKTGAADNPQQYGDLIENQEIFNAPVHNGDNNATYKNYYVMTQLQIRNLQQQTQFDKDVENAITDEVH